MIVFRGLLAVYVLTALGFIGYHEWLLNDWSDFWLALSIIVAIVVAMATSKDPALPWRIFQKGKKK